MLVVISFNQFSLHSKRSFFDYYGSGTSCLQYYRLTITCHALCLNICMCYSLNEKKHWKTMLKIVYIGCSSTAQILSARISCSPLFDTDLRSLYIVIITNKRLFWVLWASFGQFFFLYVVQSRGPLTVTKYFMQGQLGLSKKETNNWYKIERLHPSCNAHDFLFLS